MPQTSVAAPARPPLALQLTLDDRLPLRAGQIPDRPNEIAKPAAAIEGLGRLLHAVHPFIEGLMEFPVAAVVERGVPDDREEPDLDRIRVVSPKQRGMRLHHRILDHIVRRIPG
jgi:hypothetical protein